jgi:hypothetical protein
MGSAEEQGSQRRAGVPRVEATGVGRGEWVSSISVHSFIFISVVLLVSSSPAIYNLVTEHRAGELQDV